MPAPNVSIAFGGRWPLMFLNPGQVHAIDEISYGDDSLGSNSAAVYRSHMSFSFGENIGWRTLTACCNGPELVGNTFALNIAFDVATFPITHVPAFADPNNLPSLFSASHVIYRLFFFFHGWPQPSKQFPGVLQVTVSRLLPCRP